MRCAHLGITLHKSPTLQEAAILVGRQLVSPHSFDREMVVGCLGTRVRSVQFSLRFSSCQTITHRDHGTPSLRKSHCCGSVVRGRWLMLSLFAFVAGGWRESCRITGSSPPPSTYLLVYRFILHFICELPSSCLDFVTVFVCKLLDCCFDRCGLGCEMSANKENCS